MRTIQLLLKVTLAFVLAFAVSLNFVVDKAMATGQFSLTCDKDNIAIDGSTLSANCQKSNGGREETSLNLDQYIANHNGTLAWGDSDFSKTCKNIGLAQLLGSKQLILVADCKTAAENAYTPTEIELDAHIANVNGTLKYE